MDPSHIAPPRRAFKNARRIGVEQDFPRILVDVMPRHEKHLVPAPISLLNDRAQMFRRLR